MFLLFYVKLRISIWILIHLLNKLHSLFFIEFIFFLAFYVRQIWTIVFVKNFLSLLECFSVSVIKAPMKFLTFAPFSASSPWSIIIFSTKIFFFLVLYLLRFKMTHAVIYSINFWFSLSVAVFLIKFIF